ncbi:MAG: XrtA-associated tyrosine autokinase [Pseudomonadota bacterium]
MSNPAGPRDKKVDEMDFIEKAAKKMQEKSSGTILERAAAQGVLAGEERKKPVARVSAQPLPKGVRPGTPGGDRTKAKRSRRAEIDLIQLRENGFIVPDSPTTVTAEEFRLIKRSLLMNATVKGANEIANGNLILVSSSQPNEGKTFCSINLALSIASERDYTVLLVDADFAKPEVLSSLGLEGGRGLIDVVADPSLDLSDCLIRTNIENLAVLPAGRQHHLTTELLASDRMNAIVGEIAARYRDRIIIFDSPPALASSAASVLAMHAGQAVFVVEAEVTREPQIREGLTMIGGCPNISVVLNKTRYASSGRKFGAYYGYGT